MPTLEKMIDGFKVYKATTYTKHRDILVHKLQAGINPTTLVITSSDMAVSPDALTGSTPGDLYVIRNKGGLVPPYEQGKISGFSATLEYGVVNLGISNIVVLGHSHNDALQMLLDGGHTTGDSDPLKAWVGMAHEVYDAVKKGMAEYPRAQQERAMELETVVLGIRNLFSYPWIESRVKSGKLEIYGWHFDLENGELLGYMPSKGTFEAFN